MKTKQELEQELEQLKARHRVVYTIVTPMNDEEDESKMEYATIYVRKPDRTIYAACNQLLKVSTEKTIETFLRSTYIGGDDLNAVISNDDAFYGCETPIARLLYKRSAELKKN